MPQQTPTSSEPRRISRFRRTTGAFSLVVAGSVLLSGCSSEVVNRGFLPEGVTSDQESMGSLWNAAWIAGLGVGLLVVVLTLWAMFRYRRREGDPELPEQIRYNVPLEILYTIVPIFMVAAFFTQTVKVETELMDTSKEPDVTINVVGKQWSWDFNYVDDDVHMVGIQADLEDGEPGARDTMPVLYLPVNERIEFVLTARDVIHSFWVPQFYKKLDMIPGRVNTFQVTPTQIGEFDGKCAELCGSYHSEMLFKVKVVTREEYDAHMDELREAGNTGMLDNSVDREDLVEGEQQYIPTPKASN